MYLFVVSWRILKNTSMRKDLRKGVGKRGRFSARIWVIMWMAELRMAEDRDCLIIRESLWKRREKRSR